MKHSTCRLLLPILCCVAAAPPAMAQLAPADSVALMATTQRLLDAITDGDTAIWASRLSPRWFITDEEGNHLDRSAFLRDLRGLPAGQSGKLQVANWHMVSAPGAAVLSYEIDESHDFYGQELHTRFHQTDTWVREDGAWRLLASQVTALPTPISGRTVAPGLLEEYAGRYALTPEIDLRIVVSDSGLALARGDRPPQRLYAIDERIFIRHGVRGFWLFERDARGAVVRLVNWRDNNPVVWRKTGDR